jgi:signal transduction histidine kinase
MRTAHRAFFPGLRAPRRMAVLDAISRTEKILAFCRLLLAAACFTVVVADPKEPSLGPDLANAVLGAYVAYSALLFVLVRGEWIRQEWLARIALPADIVWIVLVTVVTEGGTSPFFLLHVFVISSVSVRWGFGATVAVTMMLAVLHPAVLWAASALLGPDVLAFRHAHLFRPVYLFGLGVLIGYLGEHERKTKRKLRFMLELPAAFRRGRPPGPALARLMRRALEHFQAGRGLLVLRDPESGHHLTWDVQRRAGRVRLALRVTEHDPVPMPFAGRTEGFLANDLRPDTGTALCYDILTGAMERRRMTPPLSLPAGADAQSILATPVLIQRELRGHAILLRGGRRRFTREDLEFLLLIVGQAATGFETVRLQEKAEEMAVERERSRIARDLHDGFIQSLAGIDLRVEACKMLMQRDPARVPRELEELHQAVDRGYQEVRRYLNVLRTPRPAGDDLCSMLERLAAEFSHREGLEVHLARPSTDPSLPAATGFELTQIVREALHNAVRHGRASQAIVKLAGGASHLYLVVRDNGIGYTQPYGRVDADGFLVPAAAPWSIRERTAGLGGTLRVWTQAGRGTEVTVLVPTAATAARHSPDRRMSA